MRIRFILFVLAVVISSSLKAQDKKQPVVINLKDGQSIEAIHFGQLKCGTDIYASNYIIIKGKYLDTVTEMKDFSDLEKIVPEGYTADPVPSVGNQKGILRITKKNGVTVALEDAELVMSCYGPDDKYNEITVQILNPLTEQATEKTIGMNEIQSIIFK